MPTAIEVLKKKYNAYQICMVERTTYNPRTRCSDSEYCVMVPELNRLATSSNSLEEAGSKLLKQTPAAVRPYSDWLMR